MVIVTFSAFMVRIASYPNGIVATGLPTPLYPQLSLADSVGANVANCRITISTNGALAVQTRGGALLTEDAGYVTGQLIYFTQ